MGNPNVGKSTLFSRLTGVDVVISNYAGTTVEYKKGSIKIEGKTHDLIDVPGTYSLAANSKAEEIAVDMIKEGDVVINVVDSTNLERNLYMTLSLLEKNIPVVVALNFWNETKHKGIDIDVKKLERMLGVPVTPTVAVTGQGIKTLVKNIDKAKAHKTKRTEKQRWEKVGEIIQATQKIRDKDHTFLQKLEDLSVNPTTGIPLAIIIIGFVFYLIRLIGENLIKFVFEPLFSLYMPLMQSLSNFLGEGILHDLLVGQLISGEIDLLQSMGLLTTGLYVPIAMVLPYVFAFYLILSLLEAFGYLPRLSILFDTFMHKLGLHGLAIIPMILGAGCNVPGVLSTRILESKKQRFIVITLLSISIPCMAQTAMIFGLLGQYGIRGVGTVYAVLAIVWLSVSLLLNKMIKEDIPETFVEITPYRVPNMKIISKKLFWRMKAFLKEALPYMLLGVVIVNVLYISGVIQATARLTAPVISGIFGLPKEAIGSLLIGFLRKDIAVGMLLPLGLSMKQLIISSVVLTMYFPCIATFVIIFKELGLKDTIKSTLLMLSTTMVVGGLLNLVL
ncbi:MAG: FeoB small GTPase domain-containing protein [Candidatus Nanoarchaeia archaeon]